MKVIVTGVSVTLIAAKEARAEYIALCEGDDYWINENKIETQYIIASNDESISMIVHPSKIVYRDKLLNKLEGFHGNLNKTITPQDIINTPGCIAPTASYFLKTNFLFESKQLFQHAPVGDLFIELYCATKGKLIYIPDVHSVYRFVAKNSWTEKVYKQNYQHYLDFVDSMSQTIAYSKSISGFENLDWSNNISELYYRAALMAFKEKDFDNFCKYIELCDNQKHNSMKKKILYFARKNSSLAYKILIPTIKIKALLKSLKSLTTS